MAQEPPSPSPSTLLLPFLSHNSRRQSIASITSVKGELDKNALAQTLDHIHSSASRSDALTSFHDFDGRNQRAGAKELVSSGVNGLFDKVKRGLTSTPTKESKPNQRSSQSRQSLTSASLHSQDPPGSSRSSGKRRRSPEVESLFSNHISVLPSPNTSINNASTELEQRSTHSLAVIPSSIGETGDVDAPSSPPKPNRASGISEGDVPPSGKPPASFSLLDLNHARLATTDENVGESASHALARVLSNHTNSVDGIGMDERLPSEPIYDDGIANDSDSARSVRILSRPSITFAQSVQRNHPTTIHDKTNSDPATPSRPPLLQVGASHLPGYAPSRASSAVNSMDDMSVTSGQMGSLAPKADRPPNLNTGLQRSRMPHPPLHGTSDHVESVPQHLKRRVISKGFWMKDENAKDCFSCGQAFTTFRRKHHCRTCGQIFDAKCTSLVSGTPFGVSGTLRLCKPCESMVFGSDDDSSVFTDDNEPVRRQVLRRSLTDEMYRRQGMNTTASETLSVNDSVAPSIGIPVSRRNRESKQRSNILEFNGMPGLARPSSSHSLISLARRPRSSSHRRHQSRHHAVREGVLTLEDRGPFHPSSLGDRDRLTSLSSFHNDDYIDPDLAPYASDEGSEDEMQTQAISPISGLPNTSPNDREKLNLMLSGRKGRSRLGTLSSVRGDKDNDQSEDNGKQPPKLLRLRNTSLNGTSTSRTSPWRSKSQNLSRATLEADLCEHHHPSPTAIFNPTRTKLVRSSAMRGKDAPAVELNRASLEHVRKLLTQLLEDSKVESSSTWVKALLPILLLCTDDVEPNVQRGDDMDIRDYVKLKKVPGGKPGDTSYLSGVVFSKNVALKSMPRLIPRPRIAIVTFALEYARYQAHFMSLEPVIAQEQEYLRNLVGRISALQPNVLLVQRNVSGLALELLEKAGITVAYNIKESVLAAVARITQTTMIKSVDKLAISRSHLGQCESFEVKTYMFNNRRKTYIFMSGCAPDLGCTIVLRGADTKTLRKIKRITEFMCYVAYNLKLETSLMRDEFVSIPSYPGDKLEAPDSPNKDVRERIHPNYDHGESIGHPRVQAHFEDEMPSYYEKLEDEMRSRILSVSPFVVFTQPYMLTQLRESERRLTTYKRLRDQYAAADEDGNGTNPTEHASHFAIVQPEMVHAPASRDQPKALRDYLHAVHKAQFEKTLYTYETQRRVFDSFMSGGSDPFDPYSHQTLVLLHSTVSTINSAPCVGPELLYIGFYAGLNHAEPEFEEDCTLGQFVEDCCLSANNTCKECGKKMIDHHRQYVHGNGQVSVSVQPHSAKLRGFKKTILMWATCRICKQETTTTPMSENTWRYSFAKYLELCFWSAPLHPRAGVCEHDIHKDFLRFFGFEDLVMKVQYEPVDTYDVVVPRGMITWKVESDLKIKNEQFLRFSSRLDAFTCSIRKRLDSINVDTLDEKKAVEAHDLLSELRQKVQDDYHELLKKLQERYSASRYYELIPLNRALRFMDRKALEWDEIFNNFERDYFPSETDIRKLATLQLRNMFLESDPQHSATPSDVSDAEDSGTEPTPVSPKALRQRLKAKEIESEKAHDVLGSTLQEHRASTINGTDSDLTLGGFDGDESHEGLAANISPIQDHEQAVEREEVRHLDLAVPSSKATEGGFSGILQASTEQVRGESNIAENASSAELHESPTEPLPSGLLERIEEIRNSNEVERLSPERSESKIPRLTNLRRQAPSTKLQPPPLLRAKSQPGDVVKHNISLDAELQLHAPEATRQDDQSNEKRLRDRLGVTRLASKVGKVAPSLIPRSTPGKQDDVHITSVSALARHFEQMSREFEKERLKERKQRALRNRQARAKPLASSQPVVEVYRNATDAVGEDQFQEQSKPDQHAQHLATEEQIVTVHQDQGGSDEPSVEATEDRPLLEPIGHRMHGRHQSETDIDGESSDIDVILDKPRDTNDLTSGMSSSTLLSPTEVPTTEMSSELSIPDHKKNVWFKYLAEFWSKRSASGWANLEYPLRITEHVFEDSDIIVREDEPSSVIALSLACDDYQDKVHEFRKQPKAFPRSKRNSSPPNEQDSAGESYREKSIEASLLSDTGTHMKYSFSHGPVKASCKIFYAEAFDALRRKCGVSDRFVESMSRCLKYDSKGGKTKSLFLKTMDNRFIVKSLQEVELKAFSKFAPDYFAFMSHTLFHGVPSVIAKMFGVFQVTIKNPVSGMDFSYYLLVMENLFYEQNPNRRFDLKGSMRNRKIESTGQPDEVLLDENLVETIFESPLFIREQARKLLQASVWNDTLWLCKQNVMDYSLMAGFDDERKELIVGIIDCIRTYTWDKKLESWIKDRGKNKPTITSPKDYRNRFRVSMMQYMLVAPSVWHQFQAQMAAPKTLKEREDETGAPDLEKE